MSIIQHVDKLIQDGSQFSEQNIGEYFQELGVVNLKNINDKEQD